MSLICSLLQLYVIVIFVAIALSWFPSEPDSGLGQVRRMLGQVTEPVLGPVRRAMAPATRSVPIDFSPIVVIIGIQILIGTLC